MVARVMMTILLEYTGFCGHIIQDIASYIQTFIHTHNAILQASIVQSYWPLKLQ